MSSGWNWMSGLMSPITAPGSIFGGAVTVTSDTVGPAFGAGAGAAVADAAASTVAAALTEAHSIRRRGRVGGLRFTPWSSAREAARGPPSPPPLLPADVA